MTPTVFKNHLTRMGLSQRKLAQAYGVSHVTINRYATGEREVPEDLALWLTISVKPLEEFARFLADNPPPKRPSP